MQKLYSLLARNEAQTMAEYATVLTVDHDRLPGSVRAARRGRSGAIGRVAGLFT